MADFRLTAGAETSGNRTAHKKANSVRETDGGLLPHRAVGCDEASAAGSACVSAERNCVWGKTRLCRLTRTAPPVAAMPTPLAPKKNPATAAERPAVCATCYIGFCASGAYVERE